jgi:hypothetical protein
MLPSTGLSHQKHQDRQEVAETYAGDPRFQPIRLERDKRGGGLMMYALVAADIWAHPVWPPRRWSYAGGSAFAGLTGKTWRCCR